MIENIPVYRTTMKKNGDYTIPGYAKATWHLPAGDYEYFKGEVAGITFNEQPIAIP
ncbi:hypothetical protein DSECCO2_587140 [anaerobic digester metagenome]